MSKVYMIVDNDEYELPIFVCEKPIEMALHLGIKPSDMRARLVRARKVEHSKYVVVDLDDNE